MLKTLLGIGTNEPLAGRDYTDDWSHCQVITIRRSVIFRIETIEPATGREAKNPARPKGYPASGKTPIG